MLGKCVSDAILVLWDGDCGLCRRLARSLQRRIAKRPMYLLPYQAVSAELAPELRAACADALHVVKEDGTILEAGRAVTAILAAAGWRRLARLARSRLGSRLVESGYRIVARHRRRLSRWLGLQSCRVDGPQRYRGISEEDQPSRDSPDGGA